MDDGEDASPPIGWRKRFDEFFHISKRGSTVQTEIRAGIILYATMCYIVVVNPEILASAGLDKGATASATALCGSFCTLLFALFANLPFGSAPGMGLNTLFAYEVVRQNHFSAEQGLAACFVAGCIFLLLGMTGFSTVIITHIPLSLKKAIVVGLGLLQTIIGLATVGFIKQGDYTILEAEEITNSGQIMSIVTIALIALLILLEVPGSILLGILISMIISLLLGMIPLPEGVFSLPYLRFATFDFSILLTYKGIFITFLIFLVIFVDTGGVVIGIAAQGDTLLDSRGDCINATQAYISLGIGVIVSSTFGTSPMVIFLESASAVNQGGRTGLTALIASICLALSAFFVPVVSSVPLTATAPVMVLVGSFMMGAVLAVPWDKIQHSLPSFLTLSVTAFTCSISHGLVVGLFFYVLLQIPFVILRVTGWQWLAERIVFDEPAESGLEKRLTHEIEEDRRCDSIFSSYKTSDMSSKSPARRVASGSTGWL